MLIIMLAVSELGEFFVVLVKSYLRRYCEPGSWDPGLHKPVSSSSVYNSGPIIFFCLRLQCGFVFSCIPSPVPKDFPLFPA